MQSCEREQNQTMDFRKERALVKCLMVTIDYGDRLPGLESHLSVTLDKSFKLSVPKSPHSKMQTIVELKS